jgi:hypothetical protein
MFEEFIFLPAFSGRVEIASDIPGSGMEKAMIAAGGAGAEVALIDEDALYAAEGKIA